MRHFCANYVQPVAITIASIVFLFAQLNPAWGQTDRINLSGATKAQIGTVVGTNKDSVTFKSGGNNKEIPIGQIEKLVMQGDPSQLTSGRNFALDSQWEQALGDLEKVKMGSIKRPVIKADAEFYLAYSKSKMALAGRGNKAEAATAMLDFVKKNQDSWHFYEAAKTLGDLAIALNNYPKATTYYATLKRAKASETRMEAAYLVGVTKLAQGDATGAMKDFDTIMAAKADNPKKVRLITLSKAGKAVGLAKTGNGAEGLKLVESLIATLNPTDAEMAARIYNAQGASYEASNDTDGAILAYLHTHLMYSSQPDAHALALTRLVELWQKAGNPDRAAAARQELTDRYPGFQAAN